jgi:hypothetical protein
MSKEKQMKYLAILAVLVGIGAMAKGATIIDNSKVVSTVSVSTMTAYTKIIDIGAADSASWQMTATCARGQAKISQSDDGSNFVDIGVSNSSITFSGSVLSTVSNQLYSISAPAYRYIEFTMTNSSAPTVGASAACSLSVTQLLKSDTVTSN